MAKHKPKVWPRIRRRKNPGGTISYMVDLTGIMPRQRLTFQTLAEAEVFAQQKRIEKSNHGLASFNVPEDVKAEAAAQWKRLQEVGATLTNAVDYYLKHAKPQGGKASVREAVDRWMAGKRDAGKRDEYLRVQGIVYNKFARAFGDRLVHDVSTEEIRDWMKSHGDWSPRTRANYRRDLKSLWSWCIAQGLTASNPVERIEAPTLDDAPPGILAVPQAKSLLLEAASAESAAMLPYIAIGLFAGLRSAEIERLDWAEIDLEAGLIEVTALKAKTRQRRHVTISDNLKAWLAPAGKGKGSVAPAVSRLDLQLVGLAAKAGINPWPKNALRHSFASYHLAMHKDAARTALELGHSNQTMLFKNYRELVKPAEAEKFWAIVPQSP